jgi:hypothetical protein
MARRPAASGWRCGALLWLFNTSTDYDLIADGGQRLPPKAVFVEMLSKTPEGAAGTGACLRR